MQITVSDVLVQSLNPSITSEATDTDSTNGVGEGTNSGCQCNDDGTRSLNNRKLSSSSSDNAKVDAKLSTRYTVSLT